MATVHFTRNLKRFFPDLDTIAVAAGTAAEAVAAVDARWPGLAGYLVDEHGQLRRHVNLFVDGRMVADRAALSDPLRENSVVHVMQALSGG